MTGCLQSAVKRSFNCIICQAAKEKRFVQYTLRLLSGRYIFAMAQQPRQAVI